MGGMRLSTEYSSQTVPTDKPHTMSMRALSISSSSSSSRSLKSPHSSPNHSPLSGHLIPISPIIHSFGVPFSWEHLPGIPKKQTPKWRKDRQSSSSSTTTLSPLLPPPPSTATTPAKSRSFDLRKKSIIGKCQRDPFIAALVECSKDDDDDASCRGGGFWIAGAGRLSRSIGDRLGFVNAYTSCKRSCAVSQSIISLPSEGGLPLPVQSHSP